MEVAVPLQVGVRSAMYRVAPGTFADAAWLWKVDGAPATEVDPTWTRVAGNWRLVLPHAPANGAWLDDPTPTTIHDGFDHEAGPTVEVTVLPQFRNLYTDATFSPYARGRGGEVGVRSMGLIAPHTIPAHARHVRLRAAWTQPVTDPAGLIGIGAPYDTGATVPLGSIDVLASTTTAVDDVRTTTWDVTPPVGTDPADGFDGTWLGWVAGAEGPDGWRLRLSSVRMWLVYDVGGGVWPLRQRQTRTTTPSWPLRQRQNGAATGSWPLRQRQQGL